MLFKTNSGVVRREERKYKGRKWTVRKPILEKVFESRPRIPELVEKAEG